jgi:hypothetical protein
MRKVLLIILACLLAYGLITDRRSPAYSNGEFVSLVVEAAFAVAIAAVVAWGVRRRRG